MAESPTKKTVTISIKRSRPYPAKTVIVTGFKLRPEKSTGMIEVLLETAPQKGERLVLDPVFIQTNLEHIKKYVAQVPINHDDSAIKEEVFVTEQAGYSNMMHFSRVGNTGEIIFGVVSLSDWANETRQATRSANGEIPCFDSVVAITTAPVQKKLLLELLLLLGNSSGGK